MTALNIDTLKFARRLKEAGFDDKQAEALVEGLGEIDATNLATKSDLKDLELRLMKLHIASVGATVALVVGLLKLFP